jgi:hypothetical protein
VATLNQATLAATAVVALGNPNLTAAHVETLASQAEGVLSATTWWDDEDQTENRVALQQFLRQLRELDTDLAVRLDAAIQADFLRATPDIYAWTKPVARRFVLVAGGVPDDGLNLAATSVETYAPAYVQARLGLIALQKDRGLTMSPLPASEVVGFITSEPGAGDAAGAAWLALQPGTDDALSVLTHLKTWGVRTRRVTGTYSSALAAEDAATFYLGLVDAECEQALLSAAAPSVPADAVLPGLAGRMAAATTAPGRTYLATAVTLLTLDTLADRKVLAEMALRLLDNPTKSKSDVAATLVALVRNDAHGFKGKLEAAVRAADHVDKLGEARTRFEGLGLIKRKKGLERLPRLGKR